MTDENNPTRSARRVHTPMPTKGEALRARGGSAPQASRPACPPAPPPALARAATTDTHGVAGKPRHPARRSLCLCTPVVLLVVLLVTCAALLGSPRAARAQADTWSASMTVGEFVSGGVSFGLFGYSASSGYGSLDDTDFTIGSTTYTVKGVVNNQANPGSFTLAFTLDTALAASDIARLVFDVGTSVFTLSSATVTSLSSGDIRYNWNSSLTLSVGGTVALRLGLPPDTTPPALESATVAADGSTIDLVFNEPYDREPRPNLLNPKPIQRDRRRQHRHPL